MTETSSTLSVLDFGWVRPDQSPTQALGDTFTAARRAEALGYARYWVGEHHLERHASASPIVLASVLAATTRKIRVGMGALLLYYYSPLKVAEDLRLLETLFGRIDLGVGRGRADNPKSHIALLNEHASESDGMMSEAAYEARLEELVGFLRGTLPPDHAHAGAVVLPEVPVSPEIWSCGSRHAALQAARLGTHFCCTLFHGSVAGPEHVELYRREFRPSAELERPHAMVAVAGLCAETEAEALEAARAFPLRHYVASLVGSPAQCHEKLADLRHRYGVDDIMLLDVSPSAEGRLRSLELLAAASLARRAA